MTIKDAILIFHYHPKQSEAEKLNIQLLLLKATFEHDFNIVKTLECRTDDYIQQNQIRTFLIDQPKRIAVIINNLLPQKDEYSFYDLPHILKILDHVEIIDLYLMDDEGKLGKAPEKLRLRL